MRSQLVAVGGVTLAIERGVLQLPMLAFERRTGFQQATVFVFERSGHVPRDSTTQQLGLLVLSLQVIAAGGLRYSPGRRVARAIGRRNGVLRFTRSAFEGIVSLEPDPLKADGPTVGANEQCGHSDSSC